jgi:Holliday junction DNA helicase RuvA
MLYSLTGKFVKKEKNYFILESAGIGFKIFTNEKTLHKIEKSESPISCFCFLYFREEAIELYGFLEEETLKLFEMLNTISGVGPRSALGILDVDTVPNIMAAIIERRVDLLTRASGVGRKTAERIILELHNKIKLPEAKALSKEIDVNREVEEVLVSLGYPRSVVRRAIEEVGGSAKTLEDKIRQSLKIISKIK